MSGTIYLIGEQEQLIEMSERSYDSEGLLQGLLASYPNLLAGEQMDSDNPRRWLLVAKEAGVPDQKDGYDRWSADHLFLDQDGIPTIIEVKRSSDTRIRREVVGQMLDYAANAIVYWPAAHLRTTFESLCQERGVEPFEALVEAFDDEVDEEGFWEQVATNLKAGKIRMVFVADRIPQELQRIVEFLNGQMDPAAVSAVEVKQYLGGNRRALVPRVVGNTAEGQRRHTSTARSRGRQWNETSFLEAITDSCGPKLAVVAEKIISWTKSQGLDTRWPSGKHSGSFRPCLSRNDMHSGLIDLSTDGTIGIASYRLDRPPFNQEPLRRQLYDRLELAVPGINVPRDMSYVGPVGPLSLLRDDLVLERFLDVLAWFFGELKQHQGVS